MTLQSNAMKIFTILIFTLMLIIISLLRKNVWLNIEKILNILNSKKIYWMHLGCCILLQRVAMNQIKLFVT